MQQFIFGGDNMPKTPQELARLRAVAEAMTPRRTPQNVGEGIDSIGKAILYRSMMGKADKAENAGIASANDAFSSLFSSPEDPTAVDPTSAVPPVDTSAVTPSIASPQDAVDASPMKPLTGDLAQTEAYIRNAAQKRGIDPDYAVKVARSEGLAPGVWQSRVKKGDMFEPSFGPFQMLVGDGKNFPKGMGNDFQERTGLDPRDPKNTNAMIDFALDTAKKDGWRQWYGAKKVGVNRWDGINANQVASLDAKVPASAMVDPAQEQVPVVPVPDGFQQPDPMAQQQMQQPVEVADNSNAIQPRKKVAQALSRIDPQKAYEVLNNPYLPEGRKETIRALLRQQFEAENMAREQELKQADPKYQLELEKGKLELGNLKNPPKAKNLTDDEEREMGLDPSGVYQAMPDNTIKTVREAAKPIDAVNAEKAQIELENLKSPKGKWSKLNDTTIVNDVTGETKAIAGDQPADFKDVTSLRKELQDLPSYKNLSQALPIYQSMAETAGRSSKASDLNLVYGMGKIFDPTSVVREGEQVMVRNTASLPDWFQGVVASFNGDSALTPETRKRLMAEAYSRVKAYDGQFQNDSTQFKGIAARNKFNEADVIPTFSQYAPWEPDPAASGQMPKDGASAVVKPFAKPVPGGDPDFENLSEEELMRIINGGK